MPHPLDGAIRRVLRAEEHIADLERRIEELRDRNADAVFTNLDLEALAPSHEFIHEGRFLGAASPLEFGTIDTPLIFPVIIGEVCYNLRSALDYLVYELAINDSGNLRPGTRFPIERSPEDFSRRANPKDTGCYLRGVNCPHIVAIERLQPYNGVDWTKTLQSLSNRDKHRHLTVTTSFSMGFIQFFSHPPVVESQRPVRRAHFRGVAVYVQYPFTLSVLFPGAGGEVIKTLRIPQSGVAETLDLFKPEFK
jgi:hypothetical protein